MEMKKTIECPFCDLSIDTIDCENFMETIEGTDEITGLFKKCPKCGKLIEVKYFIQVN